MASPNAPINYCFSSTADTFTDYQQHDYYLLRNQKSRRSLTLQLWTSLADNVKVKVSNLSEMSYCYLKEEACCSIEARRRTKAGERYRAMTLNDDILSGKYGDGVCDICNYHHNVIVIELEGGNHIRTKPFPKDKTTIAKARRGLLDFWETD